MATRQVEPDIYSSDYYLYRCGGIEFFRKYGYRVLKPSMQFAVQQAKLQKSDRVLDIGCGRGELVAHLDEKKFDVVGIDYSKDSIDFAKSAYPAGKFVLVRSDEPVFGDASFDKIFLLGTIEHLHEDEIEKTLLEVKRLLRPGGICVISTCTNALYYKTWSFKVRDKLARVLRRAGLKVSSPRPPRSEEDQSMHINEKHYFSLRASLEKGGMPYTILPRPNNKLTSVEVYGKKLPDDFPLRASSAWKQLLYRALVFHFPLSLVLARYHIAVISAPKS